MSGENRFEILLAPEIGDGVNTHVQKFVDSSPDELELIIIKPVPHVETALELLIDGHADILPVSGEWYNNRNRDFSSALVLPRREPTRVLVGEDKPEYIPKMELLLRIVRS